MLSWPSLTPVLSYSSGNLTSRRTAATNVTIGDLAVIKMLEAAIITKLTSLVPQCQKLAQSMKNQQHRLMLTIVGWSHSPTAKTTETKTAAALTDYLIVPAFPPLYDVGELALSELR